MTKKKNDFIGSAFKNFINLLPPEEQKAMSEKTNEKIDLVDSLAKMDEIINKNKLEEERLDTGFDKYVDSLPESEKKEIEKITKQIKPKDKLNRKIETKPVKFKIEENVEVIKTPKKKRQYKKVARVDSEQSGDQSINLEVPLTKQEVLKTPAGIFLQQDEEYAKDIQTKQKTRHVTRSQTIGQLSSKSGLVSITAPGLIVNNPLDTAVEIAPVSYLKPLDKKDIKILSGEDPLLQSVKKVNIDSGSSLELFKEGDRFVSCYLHSILPGAFQGYYLHRLTDLNYVCIKGIVKIVLYLKDEGKQEFTLDSNNPMHLFIPKNTAVGIYNIGVDEALIVNKVDPDIDSLFKNERIEFTEEQCESGVWVDIIKL
jgi:hypothetical protein